MVSIFKLFDVIKVTEKCVELDILIMIKSPHIDSFFERCLNLQNSYINAFIFAIHSFWIQLTLSSYLPPELEKRSKNVLNKIKLCNDHTLFLTAVFYHPSAHNFVGAFSLLLSYLQDWQNE